MSLSRNVRRMRMVSTVAALVACLTASASPGAEGSVPLPVVGNSPRGGQYVSGVRLIPIAGADSAKATAALALDDAIYLAGEEYSRTEGSHLWVWKVDKVGKVVWRTRLVLPEGKVLGGGGPRLVGLLAGDAPAALGEAGGVRAVAAWCAGIRRDATFVIDLDAAGEVASHVNLGMYASPHGLVADSENGAFMFGSGKSAAWVARFDRHCNVLWHKEYQPRNSMGDVAKDDAVKELGSGSVKGFSETHYLFAGEVLEDGSVAIVGMTGTYNKFGQGDSKLWLLQVAAHGAVANESLVDKGRAFPGGDIMTRNGDGVLVTYTNGQLPPIAQAPFNTGYRGSALLVARFDAVLRKSWDKLVGATFFPGAGTVTGIAPTVLAGEMPGELFILGLDEEGEVAWSTAVTTPGGYAYPLTTIRRGEELLVIANYKERGSGPRHVLLAWVTPPGE